MNNPLKAPFPYFGGKSKVASEVWKRFGDIQNYVEPFCGSAAMLLGRPQPFKSTETVNDADGMVSNFWRSLKYDSESLAEHANWPVNECDLHARHLWLVNQKESLTERLMADPDFFDAKAAGWWVWGCCSWIGSGWCSGEGPWVNVDGVLTKMEREGGNSGQGINRKIPHLGDSGQGINRQIPHLGSSGQGINAGLEKMRYWFDPLAERLRDVRVACGDWQRVCGYSPTVKIPGVTGVFFDPPYSEGSIDYNEGDRSVSEQVREWCVANYDHPRMRIALCGYDTEHEELEGLGWEVFDWKTGGGYGNQGMGSGRDNSKRERIWFSPNCLDPQSTSKAFMSQFFGDD